MVTDWDRSLMIGRPPARKGRPVRNRLMNARPVARAFKIQARLAFPQPEGCFTQRALAVAIDQELGGPPDIDLFHCK